MADEFDFYELAIYDIHCRPKGRLVARRRMAEILKHGMGMYASICFFGMQDQPTVCGPLGADNDYSNMNLMPVMSTLTRSFAAAASGSRRVGHVICNLEQKDGQLVASSPRNVAEIQLNRLAKLGLTMRSASEIEIVVRDSKTSADFAHNALWSSILVLEDIQELLLELTDTLNKVGVHVDTMQIECGAGQFEFTLDVQAGIQGPDSSARFKSCVKTFFAKRGLDASFMTRVTLSHANNGMHFNHSLWNKDGTNAFLDAGQADKLSPLCRHWMAGILHHAPALTALCCPTVNCYRRIGCPWAPHYADWGIEYRLATLRVKVDGGDNVYLENRLPSSASNPYLVMAATIAAGLDGVERKLPLPAAKSPSEKLPKDLATALKALEADYVLVGALGAQLVEYFLYSKRTYELEKLDQSLSDEQKIQQELEMYYKLA